MFRWSTFLNNMEIYPTDWCSTGTVPPIEKIIENLETTDWCSTEGGVPFDAEKVVGRIFFESYSKFITRTRIGLFVNFSLLFQFSSYPYSLALGSSDIFR